MADALSVSGLPGTARVVGPSASLELNGRGHLPCEACLGDTLEACHLRHNDDVMGFTVPAQLSSAQLGLAQLAWLSRVKTQCDINNASAND